MCIYTVKKQNFLKKILQGGRATPPNLPKLGVPGVKDNAKINKDLDMSCYIQVEYSVFFRWQLSFNHVKIIFNNIYIYLFITHVVNFTINI